MSRAKRIALWIGGILAAALAVAVIGFLLWALTPLGPDESALAALQGGHGIAVTEDNLGYTFTPAAETTGPATGLVLYPGGRVDARSYAPLAAEIARRGYTVVVPKITLNLAVFEPDAAGPVIAAHPEVATWAVGGHSLGGSMAAQYAFDADNASGLVLLASYPAGNSDLSKRGLSAVSIVGTLDGLVRPADIEKSKPLLPPDTSFLVIDGGNHAQMGSYGAQPGDNPATISPEEQWRQAADAAQSVLVQLGQR